MNSMELSANDCFGFLHDLTNKQCAVCSDNEICGIVTAQQLREKSKEQDKVKKYLDLSEMDCIDEDIIKLWLSLKARPVEELVEKVMTEGKTTDDVAVVEWIKRFVKSNSKVYIKDRIVYTRK